MPKFLYIKNMVCERCKQVVQEELKHMGLSVKNVQLGFVEIDSEAGLNENNVLQVLKDNGFELLNNETEWLVEKIKNTIIQFVHHQDTADTNITFSTYLQNKLGIDYFKLSSLFSSIEGSTIQHYLMLQRIEKVKELLTYGELNISQISELMHYRNSSHVSSQFKKITGITPSQFRKSTSNQRKSLDKVQS